MHEIIWNANLDNKYECAVTRICATMGELTIKDGDLTIFKESVGLMYGAQFGPDVADVEDWQEKCLKFVDKINGNADA